MTLLTLSSHGTSVDILEALRSRNVQDRVMKSAKRFAVLQQLAQCEMSVHDTQVEAGRRGVPHTSHLR